MSNLSRRHTGDTQKVGGEICRRCTSLQQNGSEYKQNRFASVAVIFLPCNKYETSHLFLEEI